MHRRLAASIERLIQSGELAPGTALPTERDLAAAASVSRATAAEAYRRLKATGRLASRQGRGTWVADGPVVRRAHAGGIQPVLVHSDDTIDLSLAASVPHDAMRARIAEAAARAGTRAGETGAGYEPAGIPVLREALGGRVDEVMVTTGAQQAIALVMEELVRPGDAVVVEEVTYVGALDAARRAGARLVAVPTGADGVDVDALVAAVDRHRPALVYLNPTHQSPTGSVLPSAARRAVVEMALDTGTPVVDDRTLASLPHDDGRRPGGLAAYDPGAPVITVESLSKTVWAGLRVGWLRASRDIVGRLVQRRMVADLGGSLVDQHLALELADEWASLARRRATELATRHAHLAAALAAHLPEWSVAPARGGTTLWARLPRGDAAAFAALAADHGVHIVAGPVLSPHGSAADHVRLSVTPAPEVLDEAVRRLAVAWSGYQAPPERPAVVV